MFKKQFEQTLILGAPCVLISALFIMTGVKLLIGYDAVKIEFNSDCLFMVIGIFARMHFVLHRYILFCFKIKGV